MSDEKNTSSDDLFSGGEDEKGNTGAPDMGDATNTEAAPGKPDTVVWRTAKSRRPRGAAEPT